MNGIKMVEAKLPPGFRFHPRDEELICDYLMKKLTRSELPPFLQEVDLNKSEPWDIPEAACVGGKDWYFYSLRDRKYATGKRTNRATLSGYWKATGKDRPVSRRGRLVGMRKTLVFYQGRAPKGKKTEWVMHEFRVEPPSHTYMSSKEDWVLCRVFHKNKEVPDNGGSNQGTRRSWYDEDKVINPNYSPNLPPLMDHSYISFNHNQLPYQQVPCFSNTFSTTNITPNHIINNNNSNSPLIITKNVDLHPQNQQQPIPCENKRVLDNVLNQYICDGNYTSNITVPPPPDDMVSMMIKDSSTSFAEGSSESLVSELRFPGWNDQYFDMYSSSLECVPTFTV